MCRPMNPVAPVTATTAIREPRRSAPDSPLVAVRLRSCPSGLPGLLDTVAPFAHATCWQLYKLDHCAHSARGVRTARTSSESPRRSPPDSRPQRIFLRPPPAEY